MNKLLDMGSHVVVEMKVENPMGLFRQDLSNVYFLHRIQPLNDIYLYFLNLYMDFSL